ncbi:S-adenosylmethionine hydrolase [Kibdelosporangium banguiense]|uniref:S-adenosylmethionine hydrolase n=1 Tax=Kibdelosporangium banguiense TaxID=1365924 RepID=A0ABS4TCC8_9PSEU|nr:SAM-dependent chlorinase/fluorinase [Kibdelosporangium banguiense]MBP2322082.1 S-adenosylmethionine hydrolase [Kibdelosporangium banguiense]
MAIDWISLTTDYGLADGFVAACRGVIAQKAPRAQVIDVSHAVPPQDVRRGATVLAQVAPYLPPAVHVAVVDPGVGSGRRALVVVAEEGLLVGPDNGLLLPAADALGGVHAAYELVAEEFRLPAVSHTFHGRDIFAPAAAYLTLGVEPADFGPQIELETLVQLAEPNVVVASQRLISDVLTVDHFGNIQLAAQVRDMIATGLLLPGASVQVQIGMHTIDATIGRTFDDVEPGEALVYVDSAGHVAIAVNQGFASSMLMLSQRSAVAEIRR